MPKRIPTPPGDINTRYFTICFPYPLNSNWELREDQITFSRWIASCIKKEYLIAIMYKPTARGMVIIEVDRAFQEDEHRNLLGEHRWKDFLKNPNSEERECCSQIFYSVYNDHRGAQKDGWKTINVRDEWLNVPQSLSAFKYPYPSTHWCNLPAEDKTSKRICRPLPVASFPPPPRPVQPVVGSSAWVQGTAGSSAETQRVTWSNTTPLITRVGNNGSRPPVIKPTARSNVPSAVKAPPNVWVKPKDAATLFPPPSTSNGSSVAASKPLQGAWGKKLQGAAPQSTSTKVLPKPVKKGPSPPSSASSASSPPPLQYPPGLPRISTNTPAAPSEVIRTATSGSSSDSPSKFDWASEVDTEFPIGAADEDDDIVQGMNNMIVADEMDKVYESLLTDEDDPDPEFPMGALQDGPPGIDVADVEYDVTTETVKQNLWEDVVLQDAEKESKKECPVHGPLCSKGICQVAKKMKREEEAAKRREEGAKKSKTGRGRDRAWSNRKKDRNGQDDTDNDDQRQTGNSSHGESASRSGSPSKVTEAIPQAFDHDDTTDPWAQEWGTNDNF
ncbi:hypothetical protein FB446DRAFT_752221 [Lentinula raphanica]|nr:hypothetical protein FB446DRAFT_752221 [Lentinula raphanica]